MIYAFFFLKQISTPSGLCVAIFKNMHILFFQDKYIAWFVCESPVWSGSPTSMLAAASGLTPGDTIVHGLSNIISALYWLFPRAGLVAFTHSRTRTHTHTHEFTLSFVFKIIVFVPLLHSLTPKLHGDFTHSLSGTTKWTYAPTEVLVQTPSKNYTVNDFNAYITGLGFGGNTAALEALVVRSK